MRSFFLGGDIIAKAQGVQISRRGFLKKSALVTSGAIMAQNELFADNSSAKTLQLYNIHLKQDYEASFYERDTYKLSGLFKINKAFMDHRAREITRIDLDLINLMYEINLFIGLDKKFSIVSGYRSKKTNNMLRKTMCGVAKNSYHLKGQAVDIHVSGVSLRKLRDTAIGLNVGGVGYYPNSNFVHVDVGPIRSWRRA